MKPKVMDRAIQRERAPVLQLGGAGEHPLERNRGEPTPVLAPAIMLQPPPSAQGGGKPREGPPIL